MVLDIRTLCRDARDPNCPSRRLLDLIANKWTVLVVAALADGPLRHGHLMRQVGGVSQKMLTQTLRLLESEGLVVRTIYPTVPPKVEYALTPRGETLIEPLAELLRWAEEVDGTAAHPSP